MSKANPEGFGPRGKAFHDAVIAQLELEAHENELLTEACRALDRLDRLHEAIQRHGMLTPDGRIAPAVTEARQQQLTLARLVASLRLPDDFSANHLDRGQRRGGARGTYVPRERLEALRAKTS